MSERKVLNKYYPPDFDPTNIPRMRLPKTRQYTVRIMTPCNMKCNTCGDYIAKAKKFNARKETVEGEEYLGLRIFRFYFKCPTCMAEITFKTDPKSCDYELEHGATRNFQALRMAEMQAEQEAKEIEEELQLNPMKMLENRTQSSRREMEELEDLEDIKETNLRKVSGVDTAEFLRRQQERKAKFEAMQRQIEVEEDEAELKAMLDQQSELDIGDSKPSSSRRWVKDEESGEQIEVEPLEPEPVVQPPETQADSPTKPSTTQILPPSAPARPTDILSEATNNPGKPAAASSKRKLAQLVKVVKKSKDDQPPPSNGPAAPKSLLPLCSYSDSDDDA